MLNLLLLLSVLCGCCLCLDPFGPTTEEIARALLFQTPSLGWGYQARQERDLRVIIIGGSNSGGFCYSNYMADVFRNSTWHPTFSATVLINAISGCIPQQYIGMKYDFEDNPVSQWPNVFLLEFSVNYITPGTVSMDIDGVIQTVRYRYRQKGISPPDFVFLELFSVQRYLIRMGRDRKSVV